jgi:hypothetical protein
MKQHSLIFCIVLFLCSSIAIALPLNDITSTDHFIIHHDRDLKVKAQLLGEACEAWLSELSGKLDFNQPITQPIPIFLYRNQRDFSKATGVDKPGRVLGRASTDGTIELDASDVYAPSGQVAGHEITHVLIFRILGKNSGHLPLWLNEGTAKYLTNDFDMVDRTILANAITSDEILTLSSLTNSFPKGDKETLAYSEGTSAVQFFIRVYGLKKLTRVIHATGRYSSFEKAMIEVTRSSPSQFEIDWLKSIEGAYGLSQAARFARIAGAIAMPALAVGAYLGIRRRRRRVIERYEREEWEEANWRDWGGGN